MDPQTPPIAAPLPPPPTPRARRPAHPPVFHAPVALTPACCSFCYNHVGLVNNVYPSTPGEEGPRGSALSLVIYYATSKPHKLPKIGAYLEKRALADIRKCRYGYVRVTLQILHALLSECRQNSNLISKNILRIILEVLNTPDPDLVLHATSTFILFSAHHNHQNVIDAEFSDIYSNLINKFCSEAVYETSDNNLQHKTRLSGLKALENVCGSDTFMLSPHLLVYSQKIVPAVLSNMGSSKKRQDSMEMPTPGTYIKRPSITDQLITDDELRHSAKVCIHGLFGQANVTNLKEFLLYVLKFLDDRKLWGSTNYALDIVRSITAVVQSQYQYITLSLMLERLEVEAQPVTKTTVSRILSFLISDAAGMGGLTVPELLETFVGHLKTSSEPVASSDPVLIATQAKLQRALIESIGSLAHQLAYPNQINDILAFLVNRVMNDYDQSGPCSLLVRAIDQVLAIFGVRPISQQAKRTSTIAAYISFDLVTPTLRLLSHQNPGVRLLYYPLVIKVLDHLPPTWTSRDTSADAETFVVTLWRGMYESSLRESSNPADYVGTGLMMSKLFRQSMYDVIVYAVPVLFRLQDSVIDGTVSSMSHQRAVASLVLACVIELAMTLNMTDLVDEASAIRRQRLTAHQWSPGFEISNEALAALGTRSFSETEVAGDEVLVSPASSLLSRDDVVKYFVSDTRIKDVIDGENRLKSNVLPWEVAVGGASGLSRGGAMNGSVKRQGSTDHSRNLSPDATTTKPQIGRRASQRRGTSPMHGKQRSVRSTTSTKSDMPQAMIRIEDLKDALTSEPKTQTAYIKSGDGSDIDLDLVSVDLSNAPKENVTSLLKSITATFGKSSQGAAASRPAMGVSNASAVVAVTSLDGDSFINGNMAQISRQQQQQRKPIENVELDWLTARSRELNRDAHHSSAGMMHSRSLSQQRMRASDSTTSLKGLRIKEPVMLGIDPVV